LEKKKVREENGVGLWAESTWRRVFGIGLVFALQGMQHLPHPADAQCLSPEWKRYNNPTNHKCPSGARYFGRWQWAKTEEQEASLRSEFLGLETRYACIEKENANIMVIRNLRAIREGIYRFPFSIFHFPFSIFHFSFFIFHFSFSIPHLSNKKATPNGDGFFIFRQLESLCSSITAFAFPC